MYDVEWFKGKRVTVMGLGLHGGGLGVSKWLVRHGAKVTVTDLKSRAELKKPIEELLKEAGSKKRSAGRMFKPKFVLGKHLAEDFRNADMIIRNPGVRKDNKFLKVAESKGVPIETDIGLFMVLCPFEVTAITGTKGKSTTTALLGEIAARHDKRTVVGGNIRISPFGFLDRLVAMAEKGESGPPIILEASSWQLEGLEHHRISPHVGVVTNIMEDHLNSYSGMKEYVRAKSLVFAYQCEDDFTLLNADDAEVMAMGKGRRPRGASFDGYRYLFSARSRKGIGCFVRNGRIVASETGKEVDIMPVSAIRLIGAHNLANVLAACATARVMGIPARTIAAGVKNFRGVSGRLEDVRTVRGIRYINDTTATMPDASIAAMKACSDNKNVVVLAGGADKKLEYQEWAKAAKRYSKALVLFNGTATPKLDIALERAGYRGSIVHVDSMREAVKEAEALAVKGDTVLLSPACSSFGIFKNEFDRGDQFVSLVKRMK
jgi:UDP-N-acetylmuramoylalanine--D-glutamate ligase